MSKTYTPPSDQEIAEIVGSLAGPCQKSVAAYKAVILASKKRMLVRGQTDEMARRLGLGLTLVNRTIAVVRAFEIYPALRMKYEPGILAGYVEIQAFSKHILHEAREIQSEGIKARKNVTPLTWAEIGERIKALKSGMMSSPPINARKPAAKPKRKARKGE